ncbi:tetratricopeptide repeat protein [uncultured Thiohalocapsa sp.]|uniref:tetratricopeptide repeat protein n=1 Tax=uncultured Thiohalocapsa sp. TaxID=768990 RepID=UPI0025CDFE1B|nr:tetratricopeptide repeat protein [uncultured Thiohalocapsa sp.]
MTTPTASAPEVPKAGVAGGTAHCRKPSSSQAAGHEATRRLRPGTPDSRLRPRRAAALAATALLLAAAPAAALDLLGKVVVLGERASDAPAPVANASVTVAGAASAVTTASGTFKLGLPFAAGATVTLEVAHDGHVIYRPHRGELRLPRPPADGAPPRVVRIQLLPEGDHRLLDDYSIRQAFERIAREAQDQLRPDGSPDEIDFTRYLEDLGRRLGFSLTDIERAVADWQDRKRDDPDADLHERGLVALSEKRFDDARRLFRQSRLANQQALTDAEQRLADLEARLDAQRRLVIRDLRAEAEAATLAYDFAAALKLYQDALARIGRDAEPEAWARAQVEVADTRQALGIRVGGAAAQRHLAEAVDAYRAALTVFTRDSLQQQWAGTQNNLGLALQEQGIRTGGKDGARLLAEAVDAYRAALTVYTRDSLPQDWAMTQNNLANALQEQGSRTGGKDGARLLAEAVDAYRAALTVYTRDSLQQQWATTQNNLANALQEQGSRTGGEDGARLLAEAVDAYRAALTVYTRDTLPQQWATAQNNLANALANQGSRTGGEDGARLLAEAVDAYRAALTVRTRDSLPQDWAMTQNNLASALANQGIRTGGEDGARLLAEAVDAYRAALTVFSMEETGRYWTETQMNLLRALAELADAAGMAAVLEDLLRADPHNANFYHDAQTLYHEAVFDFDAAQRVNRTWLKHNPDDLAARANLAETLLTTGRTAEAREALAALIDANAPAAYAPAATPPLPLHVEAALRLLEIAALTRLAADSDADAGAEAPARLADRRDALAGLLAVQPDDFAIGWSFQGALHYLSTDPAFAPHRDSLLPLFEAAAQGRDALLGLLR